LAEENLWGLGLGGEEKFMGAGEGGGRVVVWEEKR
jgi:hypothetical protein